MREYKTLNALRNKETVKINDQYFQIVGDGSVAIDDWYIAERNTGPVLLKAASIDPRGWIYPYSCNYSYDINECVKVIRVNI